MWEKLQFTFFLIQALLIEKSMSQITNAPSTTTPSAAAFQTSSIAIVQPNDCFNSSQYFDVIRLRCLPCPSNSVTTVNDSRIFFYYVMNTR